MATRQRDDPRQRVGAAFFRLIGPFVRWAIRRGLPSGPNVLVTVTGRVSGLPRSTPLAMLELGGRRYLQASFGIVGWVHNLRASPEVTITRRGRSERVQAVELAPEVAGPMLRDSLARFHRSGLLRTLLGPILRPPAAIMLMYHFRIDDTLDEYISEATLHPLFELRPLG